MKEYRVNQGTHGWRLVDTGPSLFIGHRWDSHFNRMFVSLRFGQSMFTPDEARDLAQKLVEAADRADSEEAEHISASVQ